MEEEEVSPEPRHNKPSSNVKSTVERAKCLTKLKQNEKRSKATSEANLNWKDMHQQLCDYKAKYGDCLVSSAWSKRLDKWVINQRRDYKTYRKSNSQTSMIEECIRLLNELGFVWELKPIWDQRLEELIAYREAYGDCLVPSRYPENPSLGRWVVNQRWQYKKFQESGGKVRDIGLTLARIDVLQRE